MIGSLPLYRLLMAVSAPALHLLLRRRLRLGQEEQSRLPERWGQAAVARPSGPLVWLHAASVGESLSVLPLIEALALREPNSPLLVTSGTTSAAALMGKRLPDSVIHHYIPLDHPRWVARFLDHWRPSLALWVESELWPNLLLACKQRQIAVWLINARLSEQAERRWRRHHRAAQVLFPQLGGVLAQSAQQAKRFEGLGARQVNALGNLKFAAATLAAPPAVSLPQSRPGSADASADVKRPTWLALSTHGSDEALVLPAHRQLLTRFPDALLLLAPRHMQRLPRIKAQLAVHELDYSSWSEGPEPDAARPLFLIDTLGQLERYYPRAALTWVGGSLSAQVGGHSPIEPARHGSALIFGPHMEKQADLVNRFLANQAAQEVDKVEDLADLLEHLFSDPIARADWQDRAVQVVRNEARVLALYLEALIPHLPQPESPASKVRHLSLASSARP